MILNIPRLVIAAPQSGSGKSTITTGLMALFSRLMIVQGFKVGPDYIDPGYHTLATGRISRNLDTWMMPEEQVLKTFARASQGADIVLIEGVMGLYDGYEALNETGSTAQAAKLLNAPVILVMDVSKMARSAGALAAGFRDFDPDLNLAGVICNRVGSPRHAKWVSEVIEAQGIPVLGCVPRSEDLKIPERHLGLYIAEERSAEVQKLIETCCDLFQTHLNLPQIRSLAESAGLLEVNLAADIPFKGDLFRIGVARDEAFCFYYEDNLDSLRSAGAEIVFFSPLHDEKLPQNLSGIYLGGGYPELFAAQLAANVSFKQAIADAAQLNMPIYAECGGLMVLSQYLEDLNGEKHTMFGLLPGHTQMVSRLVMGYRQINALKDNCLLPKGETARGHEFHYSNWIRPVEKNNFVFEIKPRSGKTAEQAGFGSGNLLASYIHVHFGSNPCLAGHFMNRCRLWKTGSEKQ